MMKKYLPAIALLFVAGGFGRVGGQTVTNLHSFGAYTTDGAQPRAGLVQGTNGYFYSTTFEGGTNHYGMVFGINSQGTLTNLWSFNGLDGKNSSAALALGNDGNFYGTTVNGGTNGFGAVFMLSPQGTFSNLWHFNGTNGGE
ncbi:MAG TPA: choice-of-anchor tandem repeat GloVer-containing protein, partial [Verrucomicrobiae bacterium]|nr:choice-of-anchor tandem repeat GloVer-containing protein [Verrucomicrobiae bacterium]